MNFKVILDLQTIWIFPRSVTDWALAHGLPLHKIFLKIHPVVFMWSCKQTDWGAYITPLVAVTVRLILIFNTFLVWSSETEEMCNCAAFYLLELLRTVIAFSEKLLREKNVENASWWLKETGSKGLTEEQRINLWIVQTRSNPEEKVCFKTIT